MIVVVAVVVVVVVVVMMVKMSGRAHARRAWPVHEPQVEVFEVEPRQTELEALERQVKPAKKE